MSATAQPLAKAPSNPAIFTDEDRGRLNELENTISGNLEAFLRVGRALEEIRQRRLYLLSHISFGEYVQDRWGLSAPRGWSLAYSAQVADVLEAAGEPVDGSETALREFHSVLHQSGAEATVGAFRAVAEDGVLPSAPKVRDKLVKAGIVDRPKREVADLVQQRLTYIEDALPKIKPHPKLRPLLSAYSVRARAIADRLEELAHEGVPVVPAGQPCTRHGSRRDDDRLCSWCRRPDIGPASRRR